MNAEVRKTLEVVCAAIPTRRQDEESDFYSVLLTEKDFKRQGLSIDAGVAALKHLASTGSAVVEVGNIYEASVENFDDPTLDGEHCVDIYVHSSVHLELFGGSSVPETKPTFSFSENILKINNQEISFGSIDAKEKGAYILQYIFEHDLSESSDYNEIHDRFFFDDPSSGFGKRLYEACRIIRQRVFDVSSVRDFLIFNSSDKGSVRVNPKYLP